MSELVWIAVPNGRVDGKVRLRVMVSPRLTTTTLADAAMEHWPPQALIEMPLLVEFTSDGSTDPVSSVRIEAPHIIAEPGVWERFFAREMKVQPVLRRGEPRALEGTDEPLEIKVDPTSVDADAVDKTYVAVASATVSATADRNLDLENAVLTQFATHWTAESLPVSEPERAARARRARAVRETPLPPDFHRTLAMLREHPNVLRSLGLVFDLEFAANALPAGMGDPRLRVRPSAPIPVPGLPSVAAPWTRYSSDFRPASSANISGGMVTLKDDRDINRDTGWHVVNFDVENGTERLRQAARKAATAESVADRPPVQMPALRSVGMMLVKRGRQADFDARRRVATTNASRANAGDVVLDSDDLLIGYQIDVRDLSSKHWLSLHRREAQYWVGEGDDRIKLRGGAAVLEEGHVKTNAVVKDGSPVLCATEVVARWDGWSLSLARPAFDAPDWAERARRRVSNTSYKFDWQFDPVTGSLPRLRFGTSYSIRARAAYFGDAGLELGDAAAERCMLDQVSYRRYDPILSPELRVPGGAANAQLGPAETAPDVVIRSDREMSVAAFAAANPHYGVHHERQLTPPRTSLTLAEQHGALDQLDSHAAWEQIQDVIGGEPMEGGSEPALPDFAARGIQVVVRREPGGVVAMGTSRPWPGEWPKLGGRLVELRERRVGDGTAPVTWQSIEGVDRLVVSLAPAEQLTLELSSLPRAETIGQFALQPLLPNDAASQALDAGRHPLVTPAAAVTFTHAVRKPLADPAGTLTPQREQNQTFAVLFDKPKLLGIDRNSTSQFDLRASWTEFNDDAQVAQVDVSVQSVLVGRGDSSFAAPLRHEFADTKHRIVTYEGTAISRYRRFFGAEEDPAAFRADGKLSQNQVSIPSSARPQVPVVLSTRPAFLWEQEGSPALGRTVRRRLAGRLRIELARPWFTTGQGELLAVVMWRGGVPPLSIQPFVSRVGLDPIWATNEPPQWPTAPDFAGMAAENVKLAETGADIVVVPFAPFFQDGRWYADIAMSSIAASSYCPFVRLAVARYQPESLQGDFGDLRLSEVVQTEIVQLLPDRQLTVMQSAGTISVQLNGLAPAGPRANRIDLLIEQAADGTSELTALGTAPDNVPSWRPLLDRTVQLTLGGSAVEIVLPQSNGAARLRIREVELIGADDAIYPVQAGTPEELLERVVYTDTIAIA